MNLGTTTSAESLAPATRTSCIYISANDAVIDWTAAWYRSLRSTGCTLPIVYIPWEGGLDHCSETRRLLKDDAELFGPDQAPDVFEFLTDIGRRIHPSHPHKWKRFYRFAAFFGPYSEFLYSDVDIVFLRNPALLLEQFISHPADFAFLSATRTMAYKASWRKRMRDEYGSVEFSSGFWAARNTCFTREDLLAVARPAESEENPLHPELIDQPFLNYAVDLHRRRKVRFCDIIPQMAASTWPNPTKRQRRLMLESGREAYWQAPGEGENDNREVWLIHWAGFHVRPWMPLRSLFSKFRFHSTAPGAEQAFWAKSYLRYGPIWVLNRLKEQLGRLRAKRSSLPR